MASGMHLRSCEIPRTGIYPKYPTEAMSFFCLYYNEYIAMEGAHKSFGERIYHEKRLRDVISHHGVEIV